MDNRLHKAVHFNCTELRCLDRLCWFVFDSNSASDLLNSLVSGQFVQRRTTLMRMKRRENPGWVDSRNAPATQSYSSCMYFCGVCRPVSHHALLCLQVTQPKTDEQRQRLQEACKDILLFKNLDQVRLSTVNERIKCKFWLITKINMDGGGVSSCATGENNSTNIEKFYKNTNKISNVADFIFNVAC